MCCGSPLRMTGCWVELQLENTVLDFPLSDLSTTVTAATLYTEHTR